MPETDANCAWTDIAERCPAVVQLITALADMRARLGVVETRMLTLEKQGEHRQEMLERQTAATTALEGAVSTLTTRIEERKAAAEREAVGLRWVAGFCLPWAAYGIWAVMRHLLGGH